jgi:RNA polymerase sigma-70 factor (ECF subfamily)
VKGLAQLPSVIALDNAPQSALDFAGLVDRHQAMVFSVCWHFLRDRSLADEVAQEVFFSLHRNLSAIESPEHATHWLRRVAVQRSIDESRRRNRRPQVSLADVAEPAAIAPARDPLLADTLHRLVASLPESPRMVMILRYQEDLDPTDIAEILDMPVATVKSHLRRSLALLREKLARRGVAVERA